MGAHFSSGNNVAVMLDSARPHWYPGEVVRGAVLLNITEAVECSELSVTVTGMERTHWEESVGLEGGSVPHHAHTILFQMAALLRSWRAKEEVQPRQYQFPFWFTLPLDAAPTFHVPYGLGKYGNLYGAHVEYHISAVCRRPGASQPDLKHAPLELRVARPPPGPTPGVRPAGREDADVRRAFCCCLCCSQGSVSLLMQLDRDVYLAGEHIGVEVQLINSSRVAFQGGLLFLQRRLVVDACGDSRSQTDRLTALPIPALPPGGRLTAGDTLRLRLPVPPDARPTTLMGLLRNAYSVGLELKAGAFTTHPSLLLPVAVYQRPPPPPAATYGSGGGGGGGRGGGGGAVVAVGLAAEAAGAADGCGSALLYEHRAAEYDFWKPVVIGVPVDLSLGHYTPPAPPK